MILSLAMEPTYFMSIKLSDSEKELLLKTAWDSITHGLDYGQPVNITDLGSYPQALQAHHASFVTLEISHQLRGCIGTLEATQALVIDIANNAHGAAFRDLRFPPLTTAELMRIDIHLSILSAAQEMQFESEEDLLSQIRPGIDGLILSEDEQQGTFLPSVWETLPKPAAFLHHLKQKAGLEMDYWSPTLRVKRYTALSIS